MKEGSPVYEWPELVDGLFDDVNTRLERWVRRLRAEVDLESVLSGQLNADASSTTGTLTTTLPNPFKLLRHVS
jgi:hypothetical protein